MKHSHDTHDQNTSATDWIYGHYGGPCESLLCCLWVGQRCCSCTEQGWHADWWFCAIGIISDTLIGRGRRIFVIVEGRRSDCWACGTLRHLAKMCPGRNLTPQPCTSKESVKENKSSKVPDGVPVNRGRWKKRNLRLLPFLPLPSRMSHSNKSSVRRNDCRSRSSGISSCSKSNNSSNRSSNNRSSNNNLMNCPSWIFIWK